MIRIFLFVMATALSGNAVAERMAGTDFKSLMIQAIDAPDGTASSQVYGPVADQIRRQLGVDADVRADVRTISSFKSEGCKRLAIKVWTPNHQVKTKDGGMAPFGLEYQMNLCRTGFPPSETIDLSKIKNPAGIDKPNLGGASK